MPEHAIHVREDGTLVCNELAIGRFDEIAAEGDGNAVPQARIVLNMVQCRAAGVHVTVYSDPEVDGNKRSGKLLAAISSSALAIPNLLIAVECLKQLGVRVESPLDPLAPGLE